MSVLEQLGAAIYLTIAFVLFFLGVVTYRQAEQTRVSRYAAWMIFFAALGAFNAGTGLIIEVQFGHIPLLLRRLASVWELFFPTLLALSLLYPAENPLLVRFPKLAVWLYVPYVFHFLVVWFAPDRLELSPGTLSWARGVLAPVRVLWTLALAVLEGLVRFHASSFSLVNLVFSTTALFFIGRGYASQRDPRVKQEGHLVLLGLALSVGTYALAFLVPRLFPFSVSPWIAHGFLISALLFGASALAWGIIRYQFLGIRMILRRGVVFSLSVGLIAGVYLVAYGQLQRATSAALGHTGPMLELFFLVVAILLFQPLVHALDSGIERLFARELVDARQILQSLGEDILSILDPVTLENRLRETLERGLNFGRVQLLLKDRERRILVPTSGKGFEQIVGHEVLALVERIGGPAEIGSLRSEAVRMPEGWDDKTVLVPVRHREELLGAMIVRPAGGRALLAEELGLLSSLAKHVGVALENIRLHQESVERRRVQEELQIAREIQKQLLPASSPKLQRVEVAALNLPSRAVGGDVYDFVLLGPDRLGVALGDVAGKGVPAALLMANIQAAFRVLAEHAEAPSALVATLNRHLARSTASDRYATFLFGVLDAAAGKFVYCNAGHNYPLLRYPDGRARFLPHSDIVLGVMENASYTDRVVEVGPGAYLLLYTDGVTEVFNPHGEEYGENRLKELVEEWRGETAADLRDRILAAIRTFGRESTDFDDITLVILRVL